MIGIGGALTGLLVLNAEVAQQQPQTRSVPPTGLIVAGVGLVVEIIGAILELNAVSHLFDAVNAYNDGLMDASTPLPKAP